jgi:hypothetical protein
LKKRSIIKWVTSIILVVILLLSGAAYYLSKSWKPLLTQTIKNTVVDLSDSLYNVNFTDIRVNLITGSVYIDSIHIVPDTLKYQQLIKEGVAPLNVFDLKITHLGLKNTHPIKVYLNRKLDIDVIGITEPQLIVTYTKHKNQKEKPKDLRSPYEKIKTVLKSAKVGIISLNDVDFTYIDKSQSEPQITKVDKVNFRFNDVLIDSISQFDTTRIFHTREIKAELNNLKFPTADSLYYINIGHLSISSLDRNASILKMELMPRYKEMAFSQLFKRQMERYKLNFDSILIDKIDFPRLIEQRKIIAQKVSLKNGQLDVFLNRDKPHKLIDKGQNFPHISLKRVNWDLYIDTVALRKININYTEYNPETQGRGTISFSELGGNILNITNDSLILAKQKHSNAYLHTNFLGKGYLKVHLIFDLIDQKGGFSYTGSLTNMPLSSVNSVSKPLAKVIINSGKINRMDFDIKGNVNGAGGTVKINYEDLNVVLMKKDNESYKKMGFISMVANALLIKKNNPSNENEALRIAHPYYERPHTGSFFNLMWKVIFNGFKESIGITQKKEDDLKAKANKLKKALEDREKRKKARQERREERKKDENNK